MTDITLPSKFKMPKPGVNGAISNVLTGKTIVITGIFPEVGGGKGLYVGKSRVKAMCESFGGRVTGEISAKTDILVVGLEPGLVKVSQAFAFRVQQIDLSSLYSVIMGLLLLKDVIPPEISQFSTGYKGNGLPLLMDRKNENYPQITNGPKSIKSLSAAKETKVPNTSKGLKRKIKMKIPKGPDNIIINKYNLKNDGFCFINTLTIPKTTTFEEECLQRDGYYFV
jgi:hypothetical protein